MVWYLETSAFLKLVVVEPQSEAMRLWFEGHPACWSSQLLQTEAIRAGVRLGIDAQAVREALETVSLILPTAPTFQVAGVLEPTTLRSLDALHVAAALELGADLEGIVTYDERVAAGARAAGVAVASPGA